MLRDAHRVQSHHSQREDLSVGLSSSVSERTGRPVGGDLLSVVVKMHRLEFCWTDKKERTLAECQAKINRHEFQAEELQRRDQQLLYEQLLQQNLELREAHQKSLTVKWQNY